MGAPEVKEGDVVDIFVDRMENKEGEAVLSRDKARREEAWTLLEKAFNDQERVMGTIFGRVQRRLHRRPFRRVAFLPGSQVDVRPVRDVGPLMARPSSSPSSRWTAAAAISWCRAAPSWKRPAPRTAPA